MSLSRCDRCNAAAKEVWDKDWLFLYFCGHHGSEHRAALRAQGWTNTEIE